MEVEARIPPLLAAIAEHPLLDSSFPDAAPGLMTGLAGIGHGLLMLARTPQCPLVLTLAAAASGT